MRPVSTSCAPTHSTTTTLAKTRNIAIAVRIARALNQGRRGIVQKVRVRESGAEVALVLRGKPGMDLEVWAAEKERGYFRDTFGRDLIVKAA